MSDVDFSLALGEKKGLNNKEKSLLGVGEAATTLSNMSNRLGGRETDNEFEATGDLANTMNARSIWDKEKNALQNFASNNNITLDNNNVKNTYSTMKEKEKEEPSDERLKKIFSDRDDIYDGWRDIENYVYKYKDEYQGNISGTDDKTHVGVMAQDLENNPSTKSTVINDEDGFKKVDTNRLALSSAGAIGELFRRVDLIEQLLLEIKCNKENK